MRKSQLACLLILALVGIISPAPLSGRTPPQAPQFSGGIVTNPLPVAIVAQLVARDADGNVLTSSSVIVPARGSKPTGATPAAARLEAIEVVSLAVPRTDRTIPCGGIVITRTDLNALKEKLKDLEYANTPEAEEAIAAVAEEARINMEQRRDERDTARNDPLRMELKRQQSLNRHSLDTTTRFREGQQETNEAVGAVIADVVDMAFAWAEADWKKREILLDERDALKPIVEQAKLALQIRRKDFKAAEAEIEAGVRFLTDSFNALAALPASEFIEGDVVLTRGVRRNCSDPSGLDDTLEIKADALPSLSVLLAEAQFDKGGAQKTFFRRVGKTRRWIAKIYWPASAASVALRVRAPGQRQWLKVPGGAQTGRMSLAEALRDAEKSLSTIEKKYKETSFRTVGSDNIKTVAVPEFD